MHAAPAQRRLIPRPALPLGILTLVYMSNCMDRTIIAVLGEAIKKELILSNTQLGLLGGIAFAAFYSVFALPLARIADRANRVGLLSICLAVWSAFTMASAAAQSYLLLVLCRMGVGLGEAGCSPTAHSLISDYYAPERRAMAFGIYSAGCALGQLVIALGGGWIAQHHGWRYAFVCAGVPGLLLALWMRAALREPARGATDPAGGPGAAERAQSADLRALSALAARLMRTAQFRHIAAGAVLASLAGFGIHQFLAPYFIRQFGVSYSAAGVAFGITVGAASGLGLLLGGWLTDRLAPRDARWYAWIPALGVLLAAPLYLVGFAQESWLAAIAVLALPGVCHFTFLAPTLAVTHSLVRYDERASASALLLLGISLVGMGVGGWLAGFMIDAFIARAETAASATRHGLMATALVYVWAAAHYALAARSGVSHGRRNGSP